MGVEIFNCEQNTPEWHECRRGLPTASMFATVMAKGEGKVRKTYMLKLAGEIVTGQCAENYTNHHMLRGHEQEPVARDIYAMEREVEPELVGFVRNGAKGCSPDALIGSRGLLQIKSAEAHILIEKLLRDDFPPEHKAQCQGELLVTEREWNDLAIYSPGLPLVIHRTQRDESYLANLSGEIDRFNDELAAVVEKVRRYGQPQQVAA